MKKIILVTFIALLNATAFAQKISWLQGTWKGVGEQPNALTQPTWEMELICKGNKVTTNYPSFPCGATWKLLVLDNNTATFMEKLTSGKDRCLNNEKVVIQLMDNNYCSLTYYLGDETIATARIKKEMP